VITSGQVAKSGPVPYLDLHVAEASANRFSAAGGVGVVPQFGWFYGPGATHSEEFSCYGASPHLRDDGAVHHVVGRGSQRSARMTSVVDMAYDGRRMRKSAMGRSRMGST
jgi:hypothetical protein